MNFVETAPVMTSRMAPEAVEAAEAPAVTSAPCQKKAFGKALVLTIAVFSFTLLGLITTTNYITDVVVIPSLYGQQKAEMTKPLTTETAQDAASVETTMAR